MLLFFISMGKNVKCQHDIIYLLNALICILQLPCISSCQEAKPLQHLTYLPK